MTTPTVTELVRNDNHVSKRVELARYHIPAGERVLHGQRIKGVVRFLNLLTDPWVVSPPG